IDLALALADREQPGRGDAAQQNQVSPVQHASAPVEPRTPVSGQISAGREGPLTYVRGSFSYFCPFRGDGSFRIARRIALRLRGLDCSSSALGRANFSF